MKKMLLGICFLFMSVQLTAQKLQGKVTDAATGMPVSSATIELANGEFTIANDSGEFQFKKLRATEHRLKNQRNWVSHT